MEPLSSYRSYSPMHDEESQEIPSARGARQPEAASSEEIRDALSELRSLRPSRPEDATRIGHAYVAATAGESEAMQRLRSQIKRIAPYFRTALILGAPGTGKEGVARMLHALSPCADGEFIAHEAATLAEALAQDDTHPVLEAIAATSFGGTLFLNDVGEVPLSAQGALLRLWSSTGRGKMRLVAGTHRDLRTMGVTGQIRPDLVQRLMGVELCIPALRERREDLPTVFAETLRAIGGERDLRLSDDATARLQAHAWTGDVAEVDHVLRTAVHAAGRRALIESSNLPELHADDSEADEEIRMEKLQDVVRQHVLNVLTRCGGNKLRAAEILGISRSTLYRMLDTCVGEGFAIN